MKNIRILFRGLWRTLCGAFVAAGAGTAGYGYTLIPDDGGLEAGLVVIGATALLFVSLYLMWCMGGGCRRIVSVEEGR